MGIQSLTYLDIPVERRQESAAKQIHSLMERLCDPTIALEYAQQLRNRITELETWASTTKSEEET